jgi:hypothetical protein
LARVRRERNNEAADSAERKNAETLFPHSFTTFNHKSAMDDLNTGTTPFKPVVDSASSHIEDQLVSGAIVAPASLTSLSSPEVCRRRKVALVTGITGQDGSYLTELLLEKGYEVHGL